MPDLNQPRPEEQKKEAIKNVHQENIFDETMSAIHLLFAHVSFAYQMPYVLVSSGACVCLERDISHDNESKKEKSEQLSSMNGEKWVAHSKDPMKRTFWKII